MKNTLSAIVILIGLLNASSLVAQNELKASMERGQEIYMGYCVTCHQSEGQGIEGVFPPLAKSDYLMADKKRSIDAIKNGMEGEIVVNGVTYNNIMTSLGLDDQEVADVLNFVRNSWGNKGEMVKVKEVEKMKVVR